MLFFDNGISIANSKSGEPMISKLCFKNSERLKKIYPLYPVFDVEESPSYYVFCIDRRAIYGNSLEILIEDTELVIRSHNRDLQSEYNDESYLLKTGHDDVVLQCVGDVVYVAVPKRYLHVAH